MSADAAPTQSTDVLLGRLLEITERESTAIASLDADALERICDEREGLLRALDGRVLPASLTATLERFGTLRDANLRAAAAQRDDLRRRLAELGGGRSALTAYLPTSGAVAGLHREG
jgi:hypothetical protein